jgi:hypothetical protein
LTAQDLVMIDLVLVHVPCYLLLFLKILIFSCCMLNLTFYIGTD